MMMQANRGLSLVAKQAFEEKVARLASPKLRTATYDIVNGKVHGVPVDVLTNAVLAAGHSFNQLPTKFYVARRTSK